MERAVKEIISARKLSKKRKEILSRFDCKHETTLIVKKPIKGGNFQIKPQCLACGKTLGAHPIKREKLSFEPSRYDPTIEEKRQKHIEEVLTKSGVNDFSGSDVFWDVYPEYLKSETWKAKREKVLRRDNYICQGCLETKATCVHHLTYERVGEELMLDLVSLCEQCHDSIHGRGNG